MKTFKVSHNLMCEVHTWRFISANSFDEALEKVAAIETITDLSDCDYEIVSDDDVKCVEIEEIKQ